MDAKWYSRIGIQADCPWETPQAHLKPASSSCWLVAQPALLAVPRPHMPAGGRHSSRPHVVHSLRPWFLPAIQIMRRDNKAAFSLTKEARLCSERDFAPTRLNHRREPGWNQSRISSGTGRAPPTPPTCFLPLPSIHAGCGCRSPLLCALVAC